MATKILVSQPRPQTEKSPYFEVAKKYDIELVFHPFIKIEPMSAKDFRQQKVSIPGHTAIVFTSRHAIDHFFALCKELRVSIPDDMKYFCVSEQVSLYIQKYVQYRKRKNFFPESGRIADLLPIIQKHSSEKYFVPQSSAHNDDMKTLLDEAGVEHDEAVMYYTVANDFATDEKFNYNMLVFQAGQGEGGLSGCQDHQGSRRCRTDGGLSAHSRTAFRTCHHRGIRQDPFIIKKGILFSSLVTPNRG